MYKVTLKNLPSLSYATNEALNTLCTNIMFASSDQKKIMFTSCVSGEGKSFISLNVARALAGLGKRVVLVDLDVRKSNLAKMYLDFEDGEGLGSSHYLAGLANATDVMYATDDPNLFIVPCTKTISNSLPLMNSDRLRKILDAIAENVDYVIVDSMPVGMVIDSAKVAEVCDGTVIVVNYDKVRRRELINTCEQIRHSGCPIIGVTINQVDLSDYVGRKYYYNKYYKNYYYYRNDSKTK